MNNWHALQDDLERLARQILYMGSYAMGIHGANQAQRERIDDALIYAMQQVMTAADEASNLGDEREAEDAVQGAANGE